MKNINLTELETLVGNDPKEIKITTYTDPKLRKTGNPYVGVKKIQTTKVEINFNYASDVNKQRMAEGKDLDFRTKESWHEHIGTSKCLVKNPKTDEKYLLVKVVSKENAYYIDENRNFLTVDQLKPFMPEYKKPVHQDLDNPILVNTYKLANIKEVEIDGTKYILTV